MATTLLTLFGGASAVHAGSFGATFPKFNGDGTNTSQTIGRFVFEVVSFAELQG